jgi:hypothetical protein
MKKFSDTPAPVMRLLERLKTYAVDWSHVSSKNAPRDIPEYEPGIDREERDIAVANVVSSELRPADPLLSDPLDARHVVAIDLDVPAYLVPSSTEGHNHLYIDVPHGIPHYRYMALLSALADCGVIEKGYAAVSIKRGHSDLRLPWVQKGDPTPAAPPAPPLPTPVVDEFPEIPVF